jgi:adenylate cyclase
VLLVCAGLIATVIGAVLQQTDSLRRLELQSVDTRFSVRGPEPAPKDVVVVGVDAATFGALNQQWPFRRTIHADVIDRLRKAGAKLIAYDVQFTEKSSPGHEDDDSALLGAIFDTRGRVVLATTETGPGGSNKIFGGGSILRQIDSRPGNALLPLDPGAVRRRVPYSVNGLKSFALVAAERVSGKTYTPADFGAGGAWIDFHGPPHSVPYVSMSRVLSGQFPPSAFRGKIVVVGAAAPSLQDVSATSTSGSGLAAGPEIQAEAISTILRGLPLHGSPSLLALVLLLAFAAIPPLLSSRLAPIRAFLASVVVGGAYAVVAQVAFDHGRILPVVYPLVTLGLSAVATIAAQYLFESFERRRVRDYFARFVPESVVDEVLAKTDGDLRLGGVGRECTVLFSDLRGFTSFGEGKQPAEVIEILNDYLTEMSDAILDHGGTLISYMGDGIMAIFGAPLDQPDHRDRALATAREMLERLGRFNARMNERALGDGFRMGIGINTGPVMCGNVGSSRRLEYTAIGDTVNTASRIESMTKGTDFQVFVADPCRSGLDPMPEDLVFVDDFPIRGRQGRVRLWGLVEEPARAARAPAHDPATAISVE